MIGAVARQGAEPGLPGELVKPGRAGGAGAGMGIKPGFEPRLREQIAKVHAGGIGGPRDRRMHRAALGRAAAHDRAGCRIGNAAGRVLH